jgi:TRAP-type C4-dicarboxylate transport system permease large subunit
MGVVLGAAATVQRGVALIILGMVLAWGEYQRRKTLGDATEFVKAMKDLVVALAESDRPSLACWAFGTILVVIGGVMSGVTSLL